jgi:hypothetical protein
VIFRRTLCVFDNSHGRRARLFDVWGVARQPAQAGIGVAAGCGHRLIHLVRQGGGQLSHRGYAVHVREV